jgi:hypothetical protein
LIENEHLAQLDIGVACNTDDFLEGAVIAVSDLLFNAEEQLAGEGEELVMLVLLDGCLVLQGYQRI